MVEKRLNIVGIISHIKDTTSNIDDYCSDLRDFCKIKNIIFYECFNINNIYLNIENIAPDFVFIFDWSRSIPYNILEFTKAAVFNTHPSLLPKNRGNDAIAWQILNNESESGVTLFGVEKGKADNGRIYVQESFSISQDETASTFYEKAVRAAEKIIETKIDGIVSGSVEGIPQDEKKATYTKTFDIEARVIDWKQGANYIEKFIHALGSPYHGALAHYGSNLLRITKVKIKNNENYTDLYGTILVASKNTAVVQCGRGVIQITGIMDENDKPLDIRILKPGTRFILKSKDDVRENI